MLITRICLILLLLITANAFGQAPVADFTISDSAGCAPLTVSFTDVSTGNPTFWNWDFGNGQLSSSKNPTVTFQSPGTYSVQLVVRNADGANGITKTNIITVIPSPVASFASDRKNSCLPAAIQFSDLSTANGANIINWEWNFGDNSTSTLQNPTHAYNAVGFHGVSLKVTSDNGCSSVNSQARFIRILSGLQVVFSNIAPITCQPPFDIPFQNETSGPGNITYEWSFGTGQTSTIKSPSTTYISTGDYNVKLKATSDLGCIDSISRTISITGFDTKFSGPDTVCLNSAALFEDRSVTAPTQVTWSLGGFTSQGSSASNTFSVPGNYAVKMFAEYPTCIDSAVKTLVVRSKPVVKFSADKTSFCKLPATVNFSDNTSDAVNWEWNFGDGGVSNAKSPQHIYSNTGTYDVRLIVTDRYGCSDTLVKAGFISINYPIAAIANLETGGCIPFSFSPVANIIASEPVATYQWDFGNGTTSTAPSPTASYKDSGTYSVSLYITTMSGCTNSVTYPNSVRTGTKPAVDFSYTLAGACANSDVNFNAITSVGTTEYLWDFGDSSTSIIKDPVHVYADTGMVSVKLTATRNGCPNSITKTNLLNIPAPIANFSFLFDCTERNKAIFQDSSILNTSNGPLNYKWEFGDPANSTSTNVNPVFYYNTTGIYKVTLTLSDNSCSSRITKDILYDASSLSFSASKTNVCRNDTVFIKADSVHASAIASYKWEIGTNVYTGGPGIQPILQVNGTYDVTLTLTDVYGCSSSKTVNSFLVVGGPDALFDVSSKITCLPAMTTFIDKSTSTVGIKEYLFDFGDGLSEQFSTGPFSHTYLDTGLYNVQLTVTDVAGCSNVYTLPTPIQMANVNANFSKDTTIFCPGFPVNFTDSSTGTNLNYLWNFGDGSTSTSKSPLHTFANSGVYSIALKVTDINGCEDSITRSDYITIRKPAAGFSVTDSISLCPPFEVEFNVTGTDYISYNWDFGDSQTGTGNIERHFYNDYGSYSAKLYLYGNGGCVDSATKQIKVLRSADIPLTYSPIDSCNQLTANFELTAPGSTRFTFAFGDGSTDSIQASGFTHFYEQPGIYFPTATFTDNVGCIVNRTGTLPIRVRGAQPFFGIDKSAFCDTGTVVFTNYTIGNDPVISYLWDFADNSSSGDANVVHTFNTPGRYRVSLQVNTASGCTDAFYDTIDVYRTPVAGITSADTICMNSLSPFEAQLVQTDTTAIEWNWNFGDGSVSTQRNPSHIFSSPGDFDVMLNTKVAFGCASNAAKTVHVVPLPTIGFTGDPVLAAGRSIEMPVVYTGPITDYKWTPPQTLSCSRCAIPSATPKKTTTYQVSVIDSFGCTATNDITITVVCGEKNLFLPNTFSPNGDGSNERFYARGSGLFQVKFLKIFNRWGEQVFEKSNFTGNQSSEGWDGTYKGKAAPADVYVYVVEIVCSNSESFQLKGNVMLVR